VQLSRTTTGPEKIVLSHQSESGGGGPSTRPENRLSDCGKSKLPTVVSLLFPSMLQTVINNLKHTVFNLFVLLSAGIIELNAEEDVAEFIAEAKDSLRRSQKPRQWKKKAHRKDL
jgi:hypothetical protein